MVDPALLELPLKSLELPTKTVSKLKPLGVVTVGDLYTLSAAQLVLAGLVLRELTEIAEAASDFGASWSSVAEVRALFAPALFAPVAARPTKATARASSRPAAKGPRPLALPLDAVEAWAHRPRERSARRATLESGVLSRISLLAVLALLACKSAPAPEAPSGELDESPTVDDPALEYDAKTPIDPVSTWQPAKASGPTALLFRLGTSLVIAACWDGRAFHDETRCPKKIGALARVHLDDMGGAAVAEPIRKETDLGEYTLHALESLDATALISGYASPGAHDGLGIWPEAAAASLVVSSPGKRELMKALDWQCEAQPSWPTCRYRAAANIAEPRIEASEREQIATATASARGARPLVIGAVADVQLDDDEPLERIYNVFVAERQTGGPDDDGHLADWILLVRDEHVLSAPIESQAMAATDLNGDGKAEILLLEHYYEGSTYTLVEWNAGSFRALVRFVYGV